MSKTTLAALGCALAVASVSVAPAQAYPGSVGRYPNFTYEGRYPDQTPCWYRLQDLRLFVSQGRLSKLKYFYSPRCGSFARIENVSRDCVVWLSRTILPDRPRSTSVASTVLETVDPGIDYAYTKVANNLGGRRSRAVATCAGGAMAHTDWY